MNHDLSHDHIEREIVWATAVRETIIPVLRTMGFTCTRTASNEYRCESVSMLVRLFYDSTRSYEITIGFSLKEGSRYFTLGDLMDAAGVSENESREFAASDGPSIRQCIERMTILLCQYGQDVLLDESAFGRMKAIIQNRDRVFTEHVVARPIRAQAEEAWKRHAYGEVADLYNRIGSQLTPTEQAKLDYARKKSSGS